MRQVAISIRTTGCKVNQSDSALIIEALQGLPVRLVSSGEPADLAVVNACTVTAAADRDGRASVHRALRTTNGPVFLTGCLAKRIGTWDLPGAGRVLVIPETSERDTLIAALRENVMTFLRESRDTASALSAPFIGPLHTRPLIKVQDGCDQACAFCIVPHVRGPSRSLPISDALEKVKAAARRGAAEVVITGVDLGSWGKDLQPPLALPDLLESVLALNTGMRFRLSSIEPNRLDARLIALIAGCEDLCPHLHVPIQSGSDRVLRAMRRPYGMSEVANLLELAAARIVDLTLGLDVLCGFPGEDDTDFEATLALVRSLPVTYLHVFPFSPRPGTEAWAMGSPPGRRVVAGRCAVLRGHSITCREARARAFIGREVEVVDIRSLPSGGVESLTSSYFRVLLPGAREVQPGRRRVRVVGTRGATLLCDDSKTG